jgi:superfamily II DNA or RNA helicase
MSIVLCPFQQAAHDKVLDSRHDRDRVHQLVLPTGAGKTLVGAALAFRIYTEGGHVLWLAKNWGLLRQALDELRTVYPALVTQCRRIGGRFSDLDVSQKADGRIYFTTLQTLARRSTNHLPRGVRPCWDLLAVWDECHWANEARMGRGLKQRYLGKALVVGLTATPRHSESGTAYVAYRAPFSELVEAGRLAKPRLRPIRTEIDWSPEIESTGDFANRSLRELGQSEERNKIIMDELVRGRQAGEYRRILVFACDIEHADRLQAMCGRRGVPARTVHSRLSRQGKESALKTFRNGDVDVLINVNMLTEGFNAPDIDTVFLARPTTSEVLLAQMIGRGARRIRGKRHFWVVDFADNLRQHGKRLFHAADVLPQARASKPGPRAQPVRHDEPRDVPRFAYLGLPGLERIPFAVGQTFGVEIELAGPSPPLRMDARWHEIGRRIIQALRERVCHHVHPEPLGYHGNDLVGDRTRWYVTYDRSAGWEIVSPILVDREGFLELQRAVLAVNSLLETNIWGLRVDRSTGFHITLASRLNTKRRVLGFVRRIQRLEPGLFGLVSPSRLMRFNGRTYQPNRPNPYCQPLRKMLGTADDLSSLSSDESRYLAVNLTRVLANNVRLIEVRMHQGTTNFDKMVLWIALWMQIFNRSRYEWRGDGVTGPVFGGDRRLSHEEAMAEDIVWLAEREGIPLEPQMVMLLRRRRLELRPYWEQVLPQRVASWEEAGWYGPWRRTVRPCSSSLFQPARPTLCSPARRVRRASLWPLDDLLFLR